jgi:uncharacterized protein
MLAVTTASLIYIALLLTNAIGVIGAIVPILPGPSLVVAASAIAGLIYKWDVATVPLIVSIVVLIMCFAIEQLSGIWGAQKVGASHWGQIGSIVGLFLGFFGLLPALPFGGPLVGMFFGPFIGAVIGELLYPRPLQAQDKLQLSLKAGVGIVVGSVIGLLIQGVLTLAAAAVFVYYTWSVGMG